MLDKIIEILENVCETDEIKDIPDEDLFEAGLLDSLASIDLLIKLEDEFEISLNPSDIARENISTAYNIVKLLENKGVTG